MGKPGYINIGSTTGAQAKTIIDTINDDLYKSLELTSVVTAAGTTTLTVSSNNIYEFTGSTTQTIQMPVVSTLFLGYSFKIINNSTGILTVNSSGSDLIDTISVGITKIFTCIKITGTDETSWTVNSFGDDITIDTIFDDSGTISIDGTIEYDTVRQVAGSEHTLTFATSGNKRGAYYAVTYQFDVDCDLTLIGNRETATSTGTRDPIPAGTYEFYFFTSHGEIGLIVQEASGTNPEILLANWDASIDASVTTANGSVTIWEDQTDNNNDLAESTYTPNHSSANDTITFSGTHSSTHDNLSRVISDFYFQQSDDFTVFVEGLAFSSAGNGGTAQIVLGSMAAITLPDDGWWLQLAATGTTLYISMYDGATQNFAYYTIASYLDDAQRTFIFIQESGVLKIYDSTNTNVGTNGSTSLSTISYGSNVFRIGNRSNGTLNPFNGSLQKIKVWPKALSESERAIELGL